MVFPVVVLLWVSIRSMYGVTGCCFIVGQYEVNVWCFSVVVLMWASIRLIYSASRCCFIVRQYGVSRFNLTLVGGSFGSVVLDLAGTMVVFYEGLHVQCFK